MVAGLRVLVNLCALLAPTGRCSVGQPRWFSWLVQRAACMHMHVSMGCAQPCRPFRASSPGSSPGMLFPLQQGEHQATDSLPACT